jgi:GWxTD domain-containing protein
MRTRLKILLFIFLSGFTMPLYAGNPKAYLNFATFTTPEGRNYFETYLTIDGNSLNFVKNANNKFAAKAHITLSFKSGDSVVASANFNVLSPEVNDTLTKPDFIDVHRFWLKKGNYTLVFTLDDPNDAEHKMISAKQPVHAGYSNDTVSVSDAEFLSSYTPSDKPGPYNKIGYDMIPYVFQYYPVKVTKLSLYCEIYNAEKFTGQHEKVLIKYSIDDDGNNFLDFSKTFSSSVAMDADTIIPFLAQIPIESLPSGNYHLSISVLDKNYHILAKRNFAFKRDNPNVKGIHIPVGFAPYFADRDSLVEYIRCLAPICGNNDHSYVTSDSLAWVNTAELKRFFYYFWLAKDSVYPLAAWKSYLDKVLAVNHTFGVPNTKGYQTDRGRVYLQYGAPSHRITSSMNPTSYPWEIWEYYQLPDGQVDIKFLFYNTDLVTNNYILLHSTANGEMHNPQWQTMLYSRLGTPSNIDQQTVDDDMGENVVNEFNNPH